MEQNLFGQAYASESVSGQLITQLKGVEFSDSFIEILRTTEQRAVAYLRLYKEENLEEIQLQKFIQDVQQNAEQIPAFRTARVNYVFDEIWLQKNKAVLLTMLVQELSAEVLENATLDYGPTIEIECHFLSRKLEFIYSILETTRPINQILSNRSMRLIEAIGQMLHADITFKTQNENKFVLSFRNCFNDV